MSIDLFLKAAEAALSFVSSDIKYEIDNDFCDDDDRAKYNSDAEYWFDVDVDFDDDWNTEGVEITQGHSFCVTFNYSQLSDPEYLKKATADIAENAYDCADNQHDHLAKFQHAEGEKIFETQYSWGNDMRMAAIVKTGDGEYVLQCMKYGRVVDQISMNQSEFDSLWDWLYDVYPTAEFDFGSIGILERALEGHFSAEAARSAAQVTRRNENPKRTSIPFV